MQRRAFLKLTAGIAALTPIMQSCDSRHGVTGSIVGASSHIGHLLRDKPLSQPLSVVQKDVVIVGGGVSGLSAARWLQMSGITNMTLLDLGPQMGGNAVFGHNSVSAFPWGAHYITIPNNNLTEYLDFLKDCSYRLR
jgi:NAD(P)-binding Rossmann-like domain